MQVNPNARNESVSVGTTAELVCTEVPVRKLLYLRNISTIGQTITVSFGKTAVSEAGLQLKPGEYFLDSSMGDYTVFVGSISAISDLAGGSLGVVEL